MYQTVQYFIRSKTGVLRVTVFKYSLRNFSVTTLRSRYQLILAMAFIFTCISLHLKFTINDIHSLHRSAELL